MPEKMDKMKDKWNNEYKEQTTMFGNRNYGRDETYKMAASWLDGHGDIEDWGGGLGYLKKFIKKSKYINIDGTHNVYCHKHIDLEDYVSTVDCINIRHVLEHNYNWKKILQNAINSFKKRMVLITYIPFAEKETIDSIDDEGRPFIHLVKKDIEILFGDDVIIVKEAAYEKNDPYSEEHIYFLEKK